MRIVHVPAWYFPETLGGTEIYVAGLTERLRLGGHQVMVAAPLAGSSARHFDHDGTPVYRYPVPEHPTRAEAQGTTIARGAEQLHAWLAEARPDIVHFHSITTGLGLLEMAAARRAGARVIVTNHLGNLGYTCQRGSMMQWGERVCDGSVSVLKCASCSLQQRGLAKPVALALAAVGAVIPETVRAPLGRAGSALAMPDVIRFNQVKQRGMFDTIDAFVVLTQWALDTVVANGAPRDRLYLNRLGISHAFAPKPSPGEVPTTLPLSIGFFGRLTQLKGVFDLARAVTALPRDLPLRLEFRGPTDDDESRATLARLRAMVAGDSRVTFADPVSPGAARDVLASYDVLCCPSVWYENGPTVALESQAVGTPVIGSRIGAMREIIRPDVDGALIEPGDWRGLSRILADLARDPSIVDAWRRSLPSVRTMDDITHDYLTLYESLLTEHGRVRPAHASAR